MFMIKPPDSVRARNSVQINAPGSVTWIKKFWSVASGSQRFGFDLHAEELGNTSLATIIKAPSIYLRKQCGDFVPSTNQLKAAHTDPMQSLTVAS
jgi:hypothetical protein